MLETVCGDYHQLAAAFAARAGARLKKGPAGILVAAPSRACADRLQETLAREHGCAGGVAFHTFISLAVNLAAENPPPRGGPSGRPYPLAGDSGFQDFIVRFITETFPGCRAPSSCRGFVSALRSTLRDLADGQTDPATVLAHAEEGAFSGLQEERVRWLMRVLGYYRKCAEHIPVTNYAELFSCAAANAVESPWLGQYSQIWLYGFYDLTGLQLELFSALAERDAVLFYPLVKSHPAYEFAQRFHEAHLAGKSAKTVFLAPEWKNLALGSALEGMFRPGSAPAAPRPGAVSVISASGASGEIRAAAREILRLREECGFEYRDIALVARTLEPYRREIPEIFGENAIPFEADLPLPLLSRPLAQAFRCLLFLRRDGYPAESVEHILEFSGAARGQWRQAAKFSRGGLAQWRALKEASALPPYIERRAPPSEAAAGLAGWIERLDKTLSSLETAGDWAAHAQTAAKLIDECFERGSLPPHMDGVRETFLAALSGLERYDTVRRARAGEFLDELEARLDAAEIPAEKAFSGGVRVLDAMAARGTAFGAVILAGLNEKLFPRLVREDPLLRDGARRFMRDHEGFSIRPRLEGYDEEKLLFHFAASSARRRLVCIYQRSDEDGRAAAPSVYLAELRRCCGGAAEERIFPRRFSEQASGGDEMLLSAREMSLKTALGGAPFAPELEPLGIVPPDWERRSGAADAVSAFSSAGKYDGMTGPPEAFAAEFFGRGISPSAAQTLAQCPMKFFLKYALSLDEPDSPSSGETLAANLSGTIYHGILQQTYQSLPEGGDFSLSAARRGLEAACGEVFTPQAGRALGLYPVIWEMTEEAMRAHLARAVEEDFSALGGWQPALFEKEMSAKLDELGGVKWRGRADRIDMDPQRRVFRVVDYKRRARSSTLLAETLKCETFQPPAYMLMAAKSVCELAGFAPEGALVLGLEAGESEKRLRPLSLEEIAPHWPRLRQSVEFILSLARDGVFFIRPSEGAEHGWCAWCQFGAVCRKNHPASRRRAETCPQFAERELRSKLKFYDK
ncbi:MAG: PD-(D/E)XK nuclease family protein [Elusimicrobiales bacterium]